MWYAAGNTSSWEMAGHRGLGVLGFAIGRMSEFDAVRDAYKQAIATAEPVGAFVNDNIMICLAAYVDEDGSRARQQMIAARPNYLTSNVFRYHDTFPIRRHPGMARGDSRPQHRGRRAGIRAGSTIVGDPTRRSPSASAGSTPVSTN